MNTLRAGGLLGWMLLAGPGLAVALSEESSNPYAVISERNVFHLNPIPPPPEVDKPKLDLPVIKLSGFFKTGSQTRALFSSEPKKKDEVRTYFNLAAGEKDGILWKCCRSTRNMARLSSSTAASLPRSTSKTTPSPSPPRWPPPPPRLEAGKKQCRPCRPCLAARHFRAREGPRPPLESPRQPILAA